MMTKKTMTILSVFMIVALTAVGFAAWLIVGTIEGETTGSFVSNELQDKYFKVEVNFDNDGEVAEDKGVIRFGAPSADANITTTEDWFSFADDDRAEKLSATATITFTPDDGFSDEKNMEYYLTDANGDQRTIKVAIDIAEVFETVEDVVTQKTDNYKWFDMAVELGYITYPTVTVGGESAEWEADAEKSIVEYNKFEAGAMVIELGAEDFTPNGGVATATVNISFEWGTKVEGKNPYEFFGNKKLANTLTITKYLVDDALQTATDDEDSIDGNEATIRYKDLARRMLDYLYEHINYDSASEEGIQFSITLSEGTTIPKA